MPSTPRHAYGIKLHKSSYAPLLDVLGLNEGTFKRRIAVDGPVGGSGKIDPELTVHSTKLDSTSFRAHREKLEKLLREGVDVQWEHALDKVTESESGMTLCLQNGRQLASACIVGADAFNGRRQVKRALFAEIYEPVMRGSTIIETAIGDTVLHISVNDYLADEVSISWIYSRPAKGTSGPLHMPSHSVAEATDIPDEFYDEISELSPSLQAPFSDVFDTNKCQMERLLHWLMRTVLVSRQELQAFARKGVFFIGDSVHTQPILGGNGANEAILDGIGLAECIAKHGAGGVNHWYDSRYPEWERVRQSSTNIEDMQKAKKSMV